MSVEESLRVVYALISLLPGRPLLPDSFLFFFLRFSRRKKRASARIATFTRNALASAFLLASRGEQRELRVTARAAIEAKQKEAELPSIELAEAHGYTVAQMRAAVANSLLAANA